MDASKLVVRRIDNVISSAEDKRSYRALELNNGLRALLVSDPNADKAAASLDVNAGHLMDPRELPGLAHFCEHMLFLGTKKYESENEYFKYVQSHGGSSNAYTGSDHTNYHFDVAPEHLPGAIDRFAQFFLGPLFTESATEREVNAVDSENSNNLKQDNWRLIQLERSLSDAEHDYSKFGTGNKDTLMTLAKEKGLNTRQALLQFHSKWYSSNIMAVCIVGKESLDELESHLLLPFFSEVSNLNIDRKEWTDHPYGPEQIGKKIEIVPIKDLRNIMVNFPIPDLNKHWRSQPGHYISHLLGHEGPGSLLSELKRRGWANSLSAGPRTCARGFGFFAVDMDLSEEGLLHTDEVIALMFSYLGLLRSVGPQPWIHKECADLNMINFRFKDTEQPLKLATSVANNLHEYPLEQVLVGPYVMDEYNPQLIQMVLDKLVPDNMVYAVLSQSFADRPGNVKEQWYGTEYSIQQLQPSLVSSWKEALSCDEATAAAKHNLRLPEPNEFIPDSFDICAREKQEFDIDKTYGIPRLLRNESNLRLWYKQDDEFNLPKCVTKVHFTSPLIYADPVKANLSSLLGSCLQDSLAEYTYNAHLAGLSGHFECGRYGIKLNMQGYNSKQAVFAKRLIERLINFKPNPERFEVLKELHIRSLRNFSQEQPYAHATYYTSALLSETMWTKDDLLLTAQGITCADLEAYVPQLLSSLFMTMLVHGNMSEKAAVDLSESIWATLRGSVTKSGLVRAQVLQRCREHVVPTGGSTVYEAHNDTHSNSAIELLLQVRVHDFQDCRLDLFTQIMAEPAFDTLRTKEQLGYIVFSGARNSNGTEALRVIVQGDKNPKHVEARVEAFLAGMKKTLSDMSDEDFAAHKSALISQKKERCKKLSRLAGQYWHEILSQSYCFDRHLIEIEQVERLSKAELLAWYDEHISADAPGRRKFVSRVYSTAAETEAAEAGAEQPSEVVDDSKSTVVDDLAAFKQTLALWRLPDSYEKLTPPKPVTSKL